MDTRFQPYKQHSTKYARPYEDGEDVSHVSISEPDRANGSPKVGDLIAINPADETDQWLISAQYAEENLTPG